MQVETVRLCTRMILAAKAAGLMVLVAPQPESKLVGAAFAGVGVAETVWAGRRTITRDLILSEQARRYLNLLYQSYTTEFMGCMLGEVRGTTVVVSRIAP